MVPVDHPQYRGFELVETESVKTPELRKVVENFERFEIDASYECYRVAFYAPEDRSVESPFQGELLFVPRVNRAQIAYDQFCDGIECSSPEKAVRRWLEQQAGIT
jgi:hypothetical protein